MAGLKLCGSGLLLLVGVLWGRGAIRFERAKRRQALGFLALVGLLRRQIEGYGAPIGQILTEADPRILADCGVPGRPAHMQALLANTDLLQPPEMCALLRQLAADLGLGTRGDQLRCIDDFLTRFQPYCEKLQADSAMGDKAVFLLPLALTTLLTLLLL